MRHLKNFNHLGRTSPHRKSMLSNMATSLILHKRITTTVAKAKALRGYVEPLITRSKEDTTHSRRVVFSYLQSKEAVTELFREISTKVASRPGGYTRIIKTGNRVGDNAEMCLIELVDYNQVYLSGAAATEKSTSRRRRRGSSKTTKAVSSAEEKVKSIESKTETNEAEKAPEAEAASKSEEIKNEVPDTGTKMQAEKAEPENSAEETKTE
ncbi:MAG TPA: 50S ribosomal protein L17 [Bacteroidales bacterium]|nr:50S ribosomal protein L17 [Bacteroidales bacterium]